MQLITNVNISPSSSVLAHHALHLSGLFTWWRHSVCGNIVAVRSWLNKFLGWGAEEKSWNVNQRWREFAGRGQKAQISLAGGAIEGFCPDIVANQPFYLRHAFVWTPFRLAYPSNRHLLQTNSTLATNFEVIEAFLLVLTLIGQFAISHVVHKQKQGFIYASMHDQLGRCEVFWTSNAKIWKFPLGLHKSLRSRHAALCFRRCADNLHSNQSFEHSV